MRPGDGYKLFYSMMNPGLSAPFMIVGGEELEVVFTIQSPRFAVGKSIR